MLPSNMDYSYNTFRRKFAAFVSVEFDVKRTLPKHVYSDENISRVYFRFLLSRIH
jgi:hypothetical protein